MLTLTPSFKIETRLENPTKYHVLESQKRQVAEYLSVSDNASGGGGGGGGGGGVPQDNGGGTRRVIRGSVLGGTQWILLEHSPTALKHTG